MEALLPEALLTWMHAHRSLLGWLGVGSVLMLAASVALVPWLVVRLPADFYLDPRPPSRPDRGRGLAALRNLAGAALVAAGALMLVLPGQGLLTILLGLALLDVPGKRALERRLVRSPPMLGALNRLRARAGAPPLIVDAPDRSAGAAGPGAQD